MFQPSFPISERTRAPDGVRPTVYVYSGIDSSSGGGISQTQGVANRRGRRGCVHVWGNMEDYSADIQVKIRVRTPSFGLTAKKQTNRQTEGFGGLGSPRHAQPLAWKGSPREGQTDTVAAEFPPSSHRELSLPASHPHASWGVEGWAAQGCPAPRSSDVMASRR